MKVFERAGKGNEEGAKTDPSGRTAELDERAGKLREREV
jgi:hypothetical protein